jgi:limonene-1,2-epoxide hydrolase
MVAPAEPREVAMNATELVTAWLTKWPAMGADEAATYFTADAEWINMPTPDRVVVGPEAITAALAGFVGRFARVDIDIHHAAGADDVVLVERTETFVLPEGRSFALPVAAAFELRDGLISSWRDYFEMSQFTSQMPAD